MRPRGVARSTVIERRIRDLEREFDGKGITFRAHFWLADDWFTPDGVPGIAAPFYLTHPRLARLERTQLLEVEGGTKAWCMRILRHEMGHALDNAYRLQRKRKRQNLFGLSSTPYPQFYTLKPHSKSIVLHLDSGTFRATQTKMSRRHSQSGLTLDRPGINAMPIGLL